MKDIGNTSVCAYNYDENGNLLRAENENGEIEFSYTKNNVKTISYSDVSIYYRYNEKGILSNLSTNKDYFVHYDYNDLNKLTRVTTEDDKVILTAEYNSMGKIVKKLLGNNITTTYSYDSVTGLLRNLTNYFKNGSVASYFIYDYSLHLRRVSVDTHEGKWKFRYDRAGQIVSMTEPKGSVTKYIYDNRKNRKMVTVNGFDYETEVNSMNQYRKYRNRTYSYDKNGNMNFRDGSNPEYFSFDEDNKLSSYKSKSMKCIFKYDSLENLYAKTCSNTTTRYIINPRGNHGSDIIEQIINDNGKQSRVRFYHGGDGIGLIAAQYDNGSIVYFTYDPTGTVQEILNEDGDLLNNYFTDPFGQEIASKRKIKSMFTFVGQWGVVAFEEIPDTYFMRSRVYDSYTGRFFSTDAYGLKAHSKNLYAYCSNNPVHFNDPKGDFLQILGGAAVGSAVGAFDYTLSTPKDEFSWGDATGAAVAGGIAGGISASGLGVVAGVTFKVAADLGGERLRRLIDHQPYTFKDMSGDFMKYSIGQAENKIFGLPGKILKRIFQVYYRYEEYINGIQPEICRIPKKWLQGLEKSFVEWVVSRDPNDILGPTGFGAARFINKESRLTYKIRFENDENATAPAQRVYIEHKYNENLDPRTFRLEDVVFGNYKKQVNSKILQDKIDLTSEHGIVLRAFSGLDLVKQTVVWEFQSLDPQTGEAPVDPGIGFLPPNNGTSGQGYVTFSIQPHEDVEHLSTIHANASIYFDENDPIDTPNIFNTIDVMPPAVNGSVLTETESQDSVTLSFDTIDWGAGVKYVDLFQYQDNCFSMFKPGLTEDIYVMPLRPGESYILAAVGTDHVGNRIKIQNIGPENMMNVTSKKLMADCLCSGNGNCSSGTNVCICFDGFYGPNCNSSVPPPEPPVLELTSTDVGYVNVPIELTISARNLSGSLEEIEIFITGFQNDTVFSKGILLASGELHLTYKDFGRLDMTTQIFGNLNLNITVVQTSTDWSFTRSGIMSIKVYKNPTTVDIQLQGCFFEYNDTFAALLNSSVVFEDRNETGPDNSSHIAPHSVLLNLPPGVDPLTEEKLGENMAYKIDDMLVNSVLLVHTSPEPFTLSVDVHIDQSGFPLPTYSRKLEITQFCVEECDPDKYGMSCDRSCDCNLQNTVQCDRFDGTCNCVSGWQGLTCNDSVCSCISNHTESCDPETRMCLCNRHWSGNSCEVDVNECSNTSLCGNYPYTTCVNKEWGYDCLCDAGYKLENDTCVECGPDKYGMNCEGTCRCNLQNTVQCNRFNGTCDCALGWQGLTCDDSVCSCISNHTERCDPETKMCFCNRHWSGNNCEIDVNECGNTSICGNYPHTSCVNKEWGYDCLCEAGYKLENDNCVECGNTKYGLNCDQTCHCNWNHTRHCDKITGLCVCEAEWKGLTCNESACPCIANNTVKCEPESESCLCQKEWTGGRGETDVDECQNKSVCANIPHTVCVNRDWGYNCVCSAGYQSENGSCVGKLFFFYHILYKGTNMN
ncbi:uncharacterized protein LOC128557104 [Mercenaria mercenaria]|uniref:uncharacterized protein LOC128557104 n=1 Tax=Mercenaria mercenaria TaxID=6596 RepID=UPI00234F31CA|nr:uncharacterized protein LOC128557104 [Mercenaria mercenaria]